MSISRSTSGQDMNVGCMEGSGADLTLYNEEIIKERMEITNKIRVKSHLRIGNVRNKTNGKSLLNKELFFSIDKCIELLYTGDEEKIILAITFLFEIIQEHPKIINNMRNLEISELFIRVLSFSLSSFAINLAIGIVFQLFSVHIQFINPFIDSGFIICLQQLLSSENEEIIISTIDLIGCMADFSNYARDALISFGIYYDIINIITTSDNDHVVDTGFQGLFLLFSNTSLIDSDILKTCVKPIFDLIENSPSSSLSLVLGILVEMTNHSYCIAPILFQYNIMPVLISAISNPELIVVSLGLIGNLCHTQPPQIIQLMQNGMYGIIEPFLYTNHMSLSLWILSNIMESIPDYVIPLISSELIQYIESCFTTASSDLKNEITYFLGTLIIVNNTTDNQAYIKDDIIDIFVEMLGSGVLFIVIRCLDSIIKLIEVAQVTGNIPKIESFLCNTDLEDRINDLSHNSNYNICIRMDIIHSFIKLASK